MTGVGSWGSGERPYRRGRKRDQRSERRGGGRSGRWESERRLTDYRGERHFSVGESLKVVDGRWSKKTGWRSQKVGGIDWLGSENQVKEFLRLGRKEVRHKYDKRNRPQEVPTHFYDGKETDEKD